MCAKLRTVTASNNRDHASQSLLLLLARVTYIYCCSSRISLSWWIPQSTQHHQRGCNNISSFLQRTTPIACSLCEGWTRHNLHILVTAPFCCDQKSPSGMCAKLRTVTASNNKDHASQSLLFIIAYSPHAYILLFFAHIPFMVNPTINATPTERLQQYGPWVDIPYFLY